MYPVPAPNHSILITPISNFFSKNKLVQRHSNLEKNPLQTTPKHQPRFKNIQKAICVIEKKQEKNGSIDMVRV